MASASRLPTSSEMYVGMWSTKTAGSPTLASPISATATGFSVSAPLKNSAGTVVTGGFLMGIKKSSGWSETIWVPVGAVSADGLTFTGVVRGINPNGYDYTVGSASFADTHDADEPVFCVISAIIPELLRSVLQGLIASGGSDFIIGTDAAGTVTLKRSTGTGTKVGFLRWYTTSSKAEYSNDGTTWVAIQDAAASVIFKIASTDTTAGYANDKLIAGAGITITQTGTGGNETLVFTSSLPSQTASRATYTPAYLTGDTGAESNFAVWNDKTDGSFRFTLNGTARNIDGIDFTGDTSMADVAASIQTTLRAVTGALETVVWSTNKFIITSADTTATSAITVLSTSTGTVGTDISGAGAADWMDADTGNGVASPAVLNVVGDAGKVPLFGANGYIDRTLLDGKSGIYLTAGGTISGATTPQAVYVSDGTVGTAGKVFLADANNTTTMAVRFMGFVSSNVVLNETVFVQTGGVVSGFTGLTTGIEYYLSTTAGGIVVGEIAINPSIPIGTAISTTQILLLKENKTVGATYSFAADGTVDTTLYTGFRVRKIHCVLFGVIGGGSNGLYHNGAGSACISVQHNDSNTKVFQSANLGYSYNLTGPTSCTISVLAIAANTVTIRRVTSEAGSVYLTMS